MAGRLATYAFINAKIRTRVSLLYDDARFEALERAGSLDQFLEMLSGSQYVHARGSSRVSW